MKMVIRKIDVEAYPRFVSDVKRLPDNVRDFLKSALQDLIKDPRPKRIRFEKLKGKNKPPIYTIHVTPNHSHKLSFEINGDVAILRRVDTHKVIDRTP